MTSETSVPWKVLAEGEPAPRDLAEPPRRPRWWDTFAFIADPDGFCRANLERHGPVFRTGVFGADTVFLGSAKAVQMALSGDNVYSELGLPRTTLDMFGEFSLFQRPDLHRRRKAALRPAFVGPMLAGYVPGVDAIVRRHLAAWPAPADLPLVPAVEDLSFDLLAPLLLGVETAGGDDDLRGLPIATKAELKRLYKRFFDGFFGLLRWRSPLTAYGRGMAARSRLMAFMEAVIERRRQRLAEPAEDFLGMMLLDRRDNPASLFSDELIANQCLLQLWGAHYEVTGLLSSWLYLIAGEAAALERLQREQRQVLGDADPSGPLTMETLARLPFLEATILETLRLLPPSSTATRRLTRDVILDGVLYRRGWGLVAEPRLAHALPQNFPEPHRFDPDRFLADAGLARGYGFIAFGGGVHACLGAQLAITIAKVFASRMLGHWRWSRRGEPRFQSFPLRMISADYRIGLSPLTPTVSELPATA